MKQDNDILAIAARATFLIVAAAICFASLAPAGWMPRVLYSYHLEHFAAFYLVALSMSAARYRTSVYRLLLDMPVLATLLEAVRLLIPAHQLYVAEDWIADVGGSLAALTPIMIGDFRKSFAPAPRAQPPSAPAPEEA
jgi:hypothetical protein